MKKSVLKYFPKLDTTVFLTFGGILLLGLIILIYQLNHRTDCTEAKYIIHTDDFITKNLIEFIDNTKGATSWKWDFGDGSAVDYNQNALHSYNKAGYFSLFTIHSSLPPASSKRLHLLFWFGEFAQNRVFGRKIHSLRYW